MGEAVNEGPRMQGKLRATVVCVAKAAVVLILAKFVASLAGSVFPEHRVIIEKSVLVFAAIPLMYFVLAPYFRYMERNGAEPGARPKRNEGEATTRGTGDA